MAPRPLSPNEIRVLGSLIEKESTTPDNYPLSLNALTAACNQTTNRDPVLRLEEDAVAAAAVALRRHGLVRQVQPVGSRVTKFEHRLGEELELDPRQVAVLGVLMLRGPQTAGELNSRTARLESFEDLPDLEAAIESLIAREPEPIVVRLPRRPGQKEPRYAHLMGGQAPPAEAEAPPAEAEAPPATRSPPADPPHEGPDRIAALEQAVDEVRAELASLRAQWSEFREKFQ
jgi:uncharacterized protein